MKIETKRQVQCCLGHLTVAHCFADGPCVTQDEYHLRTLDLLGWLGATMGIEPRHLLAWYRSRGVSWPNKLPLQGWEGIGVVACGLQVPTGGGGEEEGLALGG